MAISIVRLGTARKRDEGLRIRTGRRPQRVVCKEDYSKLDYFDVSMPEQLAPSAKLVSWALSEPFTPKRWSLFERRHRREMLQPAPRRIITLLMALSRMQSFHRLLREGETRCHRSDLR